MGATSVKDDDRYPRLCGCDQAKEGRKGQTVRAKAAAFSASRNNIVESIKLKPMTCEEYCDYCGTTAWICASSNVFDRSDYGGTVFRFAKWCDLKVGLCESISYKYGIVRCILNFANVYVISFDAYD